MKAALLGASALLAIGISGCLSRSEPAQEPIEDDSAVPALEWHTDFDAVLERAAREQRPILANFTGSDWCRWCILLDNQVFEKPEFQRYAQENLILFMADFPQKKAVPESVAAQNRALAERYGVRGFPTILLLDAKGQALAQTGYRKGGAEAYVQHLKELLSE